jgi:DNA-directed RNA polymerase specialized sigma24 family protein
MNLHRRLCGHDPTAPADVCQAYLVPLVSWFQAKFPGFDPHFRETAAGQALCDYVKDPTNFHPKRLDLAAYLRMAARGDLFNLYRQEQRHHRRRVALSAVELSKVAGNIPEAGDDPADRLDRQVEAERTETILESLLEGFTPEERRVAELMRAGERATPVFAAALGQGHLPIAEQKRAVKRVKDRIKKRLERGGLDA